MAEDAGHEVTDQQKRIEVDVSRGAGRSDWKISGRIDGVIDGVLIDVKSTSSFGFERYKYGITPSNDSFGYLSQLSFYTSFGEFDQQPTESGFVFIDKQNGHIQYVRAATETQEELIRRATHIIDAVEEQDVTLVPRGYSPEPYGKSGNEALGVACSYCPFKKECWKDSNNGRGLRTFAYNHKPISFTTITREPKVPEILAKKETTDE